MEVYRNHVCSCVLSIAREALALLPVDACVVTARVQRRDPKTGSDELVPVLSVSVPRMVSQKIAWEHVEPADAVTNFDHRMGFRHTKGLDAIEPITRQNSTLTQQR